MVSTAGALEDEVPAEETVTVTVTALDVDPTAVSGKVDAGGATDGLTVRFTVVDCATTPPTDAVIVTG